MRKKKMWATLFVSLLGFLCHSKLHAGGLVWKGRAVLKVKKNRVQEFKKALSKIIGPTLHEKGCLSYEGYQVLDENKNETAVFEFHELWTSKEAMMVDHLEKAPHMLAFFKEIKMNTPDSYVEDSQLDGKWVSRLE